MSSALCRIAEMGFLWSGMGRCGSGTVQSERKVSAELCAEGWYGGKRARLT